MIVHNYDGLILTEFEPNQLRLAVDKQSDPNIVKEKSAQSIFDEVKDAVAVLDGPMYGDDDRPGLLTHVMYLDKTSGISIPSQRPRDGGTIFVRDNFPEYTPGIVVPDDVTLAIQGYPAIVVNGAIKASLLTNRDSVWRAALCITKNRKLAFAVMQASMRRFASALVKLGVVHAVYTDGGGSTRLAFRDGRIFGNPENRKVASWLYVTGGKFHDDPFRFGANGLVVPDVLQGTWVQPYRAKIPGKTQAERFASVDRFMGVCAEHRVKGYLVHGFTSELAYGVYLDVFQKYAELAKKHGLLIGQAWGLNDENPQEKGGRMGRAASIVGSDRKPLSAVTVFDMEGAFDQGALDDAVAEQMFQSFDSEAPTNTLKVDQPWPIWRVHRGFPWSATRKHVHVRAPQFYSNNWKKHWGRFAYEKFMSWAEDNWTERDTLDKEAGFELPRIVTVQGYAWDDDDCAKCFMRYSSRIIWCEPFPQDNVFTALRVEHALRIRGYFGEYAVRNFQIDSGILVDNSAGPEVMRKLGVTPYDSSSVIARLFNS